jgi:membrane protease YdiL (CAAX protease family)
MNESPVASDVEAFGPSRKRMLWLEVLALTGLQINLFTRPLLGRYYSEIYLRTTGYSIYYAVSYASLIGLLIFVIFASGDPLSRFGLVGFRWARDLLAALALFAGLLISIGICYVAAPGLFVQVLSPRANYSTPLWLLVLETTIAVLFREFFFRSYLITRLEELVGSSFNAVLFSALMASLTDWSHGIAVVALVMILGWIIGFVFVRVRSFWPIALVMILDQVYPLLHHYPKQ